MRISYNRDGRRLRSPAATVAAPILLIMLMTGCATTITTVRTYEGPPLGEPSVATMRIDNGNVRLTIDGKTYLKVIFDGKTGKTETYPAASQYELLPGQHDFKVVLLQERTLSFKAEGGHKYLMRLNMKGSIMNRTIHPDVIDQSSGKRVVISEPSVAMEIDKGLSSRKVTLTIDGQPHPDSVRYELLPGQHDFTVKCHWFPPITPKSLSFKAEEGHVYLMRLNVKWGLPATIHPDVIDQDSGEQVAKSE